MICNITDLNKISDSSYTLLLRAGSIAEKAKPGQFLHIKCGDALLLRRPISICDVYGEFVRLVVDVRGQGTRWLSQRRAGDDIDVLGPLGHGFTIDRGSKTLLVGGGIGAPPLLYAARMLEGSASAVLGFKCRECSLLLADFESFCASLEVCSDDGSLGERCFVDSPVRRKLESGDFDKVLACGPTPMMKAVAGVAAEFGVYCEVSLEQRMGCGLGVCLVCAAKTVSAGEERYTHVCRNGPVYNAAEVVW